MTAAGLPPRAARDWIACSLGRLRCERERWVGAALVYLLAALVLHRLPFLGDLLLILLTPLAAGGLLLAAERDTAMARVPFAPDRGRELARAYLLAPWQAFTRLWRDEERLLPTLMLCVLALGGYVVAQIVGYVLLGGMPGAGVGAPLRAGWWLAPLLALAYGWLVLALLHAVALTVLDGRLPTAALVDSLRAGARNLAPLLLLTVAFLVPYAAIAAAFGLSRALGYAALLTLGTAALALFLPAVRCSFESLHRDTRVDIADLV